MDFPPSKLKSGYGEQACYVLDCLAEEALKYSGFSWKRYSTLGRILTYFSTNINGSYKGRYTKYHIVQKGFT